MGRIFGTDGVRGIANTELTCELAMNIGRAAAMVLTAKQKERPRFIIGKDTRISSDMLESAIAAGLCSVGADAILVGVVPTPAVAHLVATGHGDAGIMISASHNSYEFNGIKLFDSAGYKLSEEQEFAIEAIILDQVKPYSLLWNDEIGHISRQPELLISHYCSYLAQTVTEDLAGFRVALDCSHGSASATAEALFRGLGVQVTMLSDQPDGMNINKECGSTHVNQLAEFVKTGEFDAGFAFDGDADRCMAVDERGNVLDGDYILAMLAMALKEQGRLRDDTVVATIMSNLGLLKFAQREGLVIKQTKVGDKYVLEELHDHHHTLGGEQSGHIILYDYICTGDGQLAALHLLAALRHSGTTLSQLGQVMTAYPQVMKNFRADKRMKNFLEVDAGVAKIIQNAQNVLGEEGRILVRASGTEPLVRVMIEGQNQDEIETLVAKVSEEIHERLVSIS